MSYTQLQSVVAPETFIREQVCDCFSRFYYTTILDGTTFLRVGFWTSLITCDISCPDLQWPMELASHLSIYSWFGWIFKVKHIKKSSFSITRNLIPHLKALKIHVFLMYFFGRGPNSPKAMWTSSTCIGLECLWQYHGWLNSLGEVDFLCHFWIFLFVRVKWVENEWELWICMLNLYQPSN